jgi:hypothetical protein
MAQGQETTSTAVTTDQVRSDITGAQPPARARRQRDHDQQDAEQVTLDDALEETVTVAIAVPGAGTIRRAANRPMAGRRATMAPSRVDGARGHALAGVEIPADRPRR